MSITLFIVILNYLLLVANESRIFRASSSTWQHLLYSREDTNSLRNAIAQESRSATIVERKTAVLSRSLLAMTLPPRSVSEEPASRTLRESNLTSEVVRHSARFIRLCTASLHVDFSSHGERPSPGPKVGRSRGNLNAAAIYTLLLRAINFLKRSDGNSRH